MHDAETPRVQLVPQTIADVRAMVDAMSPTDRAMLSPEWLARLDGRAAVDQWTFGYRIVDRVSHTPMGQCGFITFIYNFVGLRTERNHRAIAPICG